MIYFKFNFEKQKYCVYTFLWTSYLTNQIIFKIISIIIPHDLQQQSVKACGMDAPGTIKPYAFCSAETMINSPINSYFISSDIEDYIVVKNLVTKLILIVQASRQCLLKPSFSGVTEEIHHHK